MSRPLEQLWQRGADFLGVKHAIMGGAMTWVSEHNLVSAISNAGGFGVLACGSMPPDILASEIIATRTLTDKPFGVNLIIMHPALDDLADICIQHQVSHVVLAGGLPKKPLMDKLKEAGIKVLAFAPALVIARRLVKMGIDGLIIEGMEAGGHIGPVSTAVLVQEILPEVTEVPIFVAGGIGRGEAIVTYLEMGASGVQLGTRFVCATESVAHERFKQAFIRASARDATTSTQLHPDFTVIPVRALENQATKDFMEFQRQTINRWQSGELPKEKAQLEIEHYWAGALRRAVIEGDVEHGSVMAGQSVGMVSAIEPAATIINGLIEQANSFIVQHNHRLAGLL